MNKVNTLDALKGKWRQQIGAARQVKNFFDQYSS